MGLHRAVDFSFRELLAGETPYRGLNVMGVIAQHVHAPIPDIATVRNDVPRSLNTLMQARADTFLANRRDVEMKELKAALQA